MKKAFLLIFVFIFVGTLALPRSIRAQERDKVPLYPLAAPLLFNQEAMAANSWSFFLLSEHYMHQLISKIGGGIGTIAAATAWQFFIIYNTVVWPHEFGHWNRAREVGLNWSITGFGFPIPPATDNGPRDTSNRAITMLNLGGPEMNHLMGLHSQKRIYEQGFGYSDEMFAATLNKLMFQFQTFVMEGYADPGNPDTWTNTGPGDPVEHVLHIHRIYRGRAAVTNGVVDPGIKDLYYETLAASFWTLLDPFVALSFYRFGKGYLANGERRAEPWWFHTGPVDWMYGTQFNLSPLGYELYLNTYLKWEDYFSTTYVRYGRPVKSYGFGTEFPNVLEVGRFEIGAGLDLWDQRDFGAGGSGRLMIQTELTERLGLIGRFGWKSDGYLIGQPLANSGFGYAGVTVSY